MHGNPTLWQGPQDLPVLLSCPVQFTKPLSPRCAQGPLERSPSVTYHGGDVDDPLHGLGVVDALPQQALRVQPGLGIGIAEPGQERSLARRIGQFGAVRGRGPDLHHCVGGAAATAVAAAATAAATAAAAAAAAVGVAAAGAAAGAAAAAVAAAAAAAASGWTGRLAPGGPVGKQESAGKHSDSLFCPSWTPLLPTSTANDTQEPGAPAG